MSRYDRAVRSTVPSIATAGDIEALRAQLTAREERRPEDFETLLPWNARPALNS
jgi:hypothetical protein